jgi:predicted HNH restriction endonuclease
MNEKWKILVYQKTIYDNYEVSNLGLIRNKTTGKILKTLECESGNKNGTSYLTVSIGLGKRGNKKKIIIHRAVAECFIDNPNNYGYVHFKDNDHKNICAENLYWSKHRKGDEHYNEYIKAKRRKANNSKAVSERRRKIKEMAVEYKGGKCIFCGYSRCIGALEFHHLSPEEKDFSIASTGTTKSWERIKKELDKCICVCANCHREIHNGIISVEEIQEKVA